MKTGTLLSLVFTGVIFLFVLNLSSCKKDEDVKPSPLINSFTPATGITGTTITITGVNFGATAEKNAVKFNNTNATITSASSTSIVTTVPNGATTGKISVTANGITAVSATDFIVNVPPAITSFSPEQAPVGETVVITGSNFSSTAANNIVKFNNTAASVTAATSTSITTTVPVGATSGKITVTVNDLTATSLNDFTVLVPPTITSFAPLYGPVGSTVTITGTNFSTIVADNTVEINGIAATISAASATELTIQVPAGATTGKIEVTVEGLTATSNDDFQVGCADLSFLTVTITSISGNNFNFNYKIKNTGTIPLDLSNMYLQTYVSINNVFGGGDDEGSGGFGVFGDTEPLLQPNEVREKTAMVTASSINITTHPYVILQLLNYETPPYAECNTANNETSKLIAYDIPRDGLVAFYPFSGNANDASGNDLHGTVTSAVLTTDRFGNSNKAYSFDGNADYISVGNPVKLQITNDISIGLWVKNDAFEDGAVMLSKRAKTNQSGTEGHGYAILLSSTGNGDPYYSIRIEYPGSGDGGLNFAGTVPFTADEWVFFAFTLDGSTAKFYKNGVEGFAVDNHQPLTAATEGNFEIGRNSGGGFDFTGLIDDVAVYNRTLTADEIMQLYLQTVSKH